jgi:phenylacetate-CoA ligase
MPKSPEAIRCYRDRQLARLIAEVYRHVPYYRTLLDQAGVSPVDIRCVEDLVRIPISSKDDLRRRPQTVLSDRRTLFPPQHLFTSGSSGEPLHIRRTYGENAISRVIKHRNLSAYGLRRRDRKAIISMYASKQHKARLAKRFLTALLNLWDRRILFSCLEKPEEMLTELDRLQPDVVMGYAGVLARLGDLYTTRPPKGWTPQIVLSSAEMLTPLHRRQIEVGFGAPVYDFYAANETGLIAWQCPETGLYHVADDHIVLELEQDGEPVAREDGARGATIVTNLHAYTMPFIRYRLDDVVVCGPSPCPCGAPFSTLRAIEGRSMDYFVLSDGRHIHPYDISTAFIRAEPAIRQYQIVQESPDTLILRIVPTAITPQPDFDYIPGRIREHLGMGVNVRIEQVDALEPGPTGKYRRFVRQ